MVQLPTKEKIIGDPIEEKKLADRKCLYCGFTEGIEPVSGDGGYGQPKVYACTDVNACLHRADRQVITGVFTKEAKP